MTRVTDIDDAARTHETREAVRVALRRGRPLSALARELGVPVPTVEAFIAGANVTPGLLTDMSRLLARSSGKPTRDIMRMSARTLKCTLLLEASELVDPGGSARVSLQISVAGDRTVTADVASKSVRKCRAVIAEHGADNVALVLQGKLMDDGTVSEAGLVAQPKTPKKAAGA
jgi:hypothetical protein